jgi:ABC-type transport system involved in cytochrome bd biosynthesis fused ATPase/permease subunit
LQAHVSVKRIEDFLKEDEGKLHRPHQTRDEADEAVPDWVSSLKHQPEATPESRSIGFKHATLQWNTGKQSEESEPKDKKAKKDKQDKKGKKDQKAVTNGDSTSPTSSTPADSTLVAETPFQLIDLSVDFPTGKLSVVSGPTGSGKSAILTALLGEMELLEGQTYLPKQSTQVDPETGLRNSVAYASQTPWLQQKSIKDNILFGEEYNEERYDATLEACALVPDLEMLEDGDQTEIGAKGVSLLSVSKWDVG